MASNLLTIDQITNESLMVLHQKLNFVTNIVTEYDNSFAQAGAKIGNTLRIRLPMEYGTGTGPTITTGTGADSLQNEVTLTVNTQRHVPMRFTSNELTMKVDEFRTRHIEPAMSRLAAMIENDALGMINNVPGVVSAGTAVGLSEVLSGKVVMDKALAPLDNRIALLDPQGQADLLTDTKGLFNDQTSISQQYKEGAMGRTAGYEFYQNTLLQNHTSGAAVGVTGTKQYTVNGNQSGSYTSPNTMSLLVQAGTATIKKGDVFTIANVYDVHPESKVSTGVLKQFTVLADATGAGNLSISPAIISSGRYQNASAQAGTGAALTFVGSASTAYNQSLLFQKGFACFGTADLVLPPNVQASRAVYDGISLRMVMNAYDVKTDRLYTRLDVLYGYKVLRPTLACKIWHT